MPWDSLIQRDTNGATRFAAPMSELFHTGSRKVPDPDDYQPSRYLTLPLATSQSRFFGEKRKLDCCDLRDGVILLPRRACRGRYAPFISNRMRFFPLPNFSAFHALFPGTVFRCERKSAAAKSSVKSHWFFKVESVEANVRPTVSLVGPASVIGEVARFAPQRRTVPFLRC